MTVSFYGDWPHIGIRVERLKGAYQQQRRAQKLVMELGRAVAKEVTHHIKMQDLDWVPLFDRTIERKGHEKVYLETFEYFKSIRVMLTDTSRNESEASVFAAGMHPKAGLPIQYLALVLENGTATIPARPLWRPVFDNIESLPAFQRLREQFAFEITGGLI
jgi:hypothetical protein